MIKICFVTTIYGTFNSFLKELSEYLYSTNEYNISLICDEESIGNEIIPEHVNYYPVKMKRGVSITALTAIKSIEKIFKKEKFDIVQYSTPNAAFYASIAAKKAEIPVRLYCQWGIRYVGFDGWRRSIFKYLEKKTCDNSTFIEVESHNIRDFSISEKLYPAEKSCVIWNGSASGVNFKKFDISKRDIWRDETRNKYNIGKDNMVFAFAGRLTADKGVNELLGAFLSLQSKVKNVTLLIMGGKDNYESINASLIEKATSSNNVIFTGNVNNIECYYAAADVFVAPSYREGFGLVVIEAEAMGLPALVSNVPGQIDAIVPGKTGLSFTVKDTKSLEDAMFRLYNDSNLRIQFGKEAVKFAKENFEQTVLFKKIKAQRDFLVTKSTNQKKE